MFASHVHGYCHRGTNALKVAGRLAEQPLAFESEVGGMLVADAMAGAGRIEVVGDQQPTSFPFVVVGS